MSQKNLLNLVHSQLAQGVVLSLVEECDILQSIEFKEVQSNSYSYNLADVLPEVVFRELGEQPVEGHLITEVERENLAIAYADVSVDRALAKFENINSVMAENTEAAAKAMAKELSKTFFYGDNEVNPKEFNGLEKRLAKGKGTKVTHTLTGAKEDLDKLEEMIDSVDGRPSVIYCNKNTRRMINKIARANGYYAPIERFGKVVDGFDGIPLVVAAEVKDGEVFAVRFGTQYVQGLTIDGVEVEDLGTVGVFRKAKIEALIGIMTAHPKCFAMLKPAAVKTRRMA